MKRLQSAGIGANCAAGRKKLRERPRGGRKEKARPKARVKKEEVGKWTHPAGKKWAVQT